MYFFSPYCVIDSVQQFVHLHNHTDFSIQDGLQRLKVMCELAAADGQSAIAITDHGTLGGAWSLARECGNVGIKPIIGVEAYLRLDDKQDEITIGARKVHYYHITLIAQNNVGYKNLLQMQSIAWRDNAYHGKPIVTIDSLASHSDGVIALSGCLSGVVLAHLANGEPEVARNNLGLLSEIFDDDHLWIEIMTHGIDIEDASTDRLVQMGKEFGLRPVVTNDSHFTLPTERLAHEAQLALGRHQKITTPDRWTFNGDGYYLRSADEMYGLFGNTYKRGLTNSLVIASMVDDNVLPEPKIRIPHYTPRPDEPQGLGSVKLLQRKVAAGAAQLYGTPLPDAVRGRLNHEFKIIVSKGFEDYFLVVADMLEWARSQGILVGPGRGSAAGSLIAYCLDIVRVDPLKYGLLFERFLNPDRTEMPDIDSDFEDARRGEVIEYLARRWGEDRVVRIGSFNLRKTKLSIQDAASFLDVPKPNALTKAVVDKSTGKSFSIGEMLADDNPQFKTFQRLAGEDEDTKKVVQLAGDLEDSIKSLGIHACGVLIGSDPIDTLVPTRIVEDKKTGKLTRISEWEHNDISDVGLLKLDALGLSALGKLKQTLELIELTHGVKLDMDDFIGHTDDIDQPDIFNTWKLISSGDTSGIFQLESSGMQKLCTQVQPRSLADLGAIIALFRPGPMGMKMHERYAEIRNGGGEPDYSIFSDDPKEVELIDSVLNTTLGIPIYQEQLMALAGVVAGFSPSGREKVRKAVSKKIEEQMRQVGEEFIKGAISDTDTDGQPKLVFRRSTAEHLWDAIKSAGSYAFNASHAIGYAQLAWQIAYLRANYPAESTAGTLASSSNKSNVYAAVRTAMRDGVTVVCPNINQSNALPTVADGRVVMGLESVKGLREVVINKIVSEREAGGEFKTTEDFFSRVPLNKSDTISLAEAGAFDGLAPRYGVASIASTISIEPSLPIPAIEWPEQELAWREARQLGLVVSADVLKKKLPVIKRKHQGQLNARSIRQLIDSTDLDDLKTVSTYGMVTSFSIITKGTRRARLELVDDDGSVIDAVMWSRTIDELFGDIDADDPINVGDVLIVNGRPSFYSRRATVTDEQGEESEELISVPQLTIYKLEAV